MWSLNQAFIITMSRSWENSSGLFPLPLLSPRIYNTNRWNRLLWMPDFVFGYSVISLHILFPLFFCRFFYCGVLLLDHIDFLWFFISSILHYIPSWYFKICLQLHLVSPSQPRDPSLVFVQTLKGALPVANFSSSYFSISPPISLLECRGPRLVTSIVVF